MFVQSPLCIVFRLLTFNVAWGQLGHNTYRVRAAFLNQRGIKIFSTSGARFAYYKLWDNSSIAAPLAQWAVVQEATFEANASSELWDNPSIAALLAQWVVVYKAAFRANAWLELGDDSTKAALLAQWVVVQKATFGTNASSELWDNPSIAALLAHWIELATTHRHGPGFLLGFQTWKGN